MMVSLRDYLDMRLCNMQKAVDVASKEMDRRLEGMNEFRAQLDRQTRTFVTQIEHDVLCDRIGSLEITRAELAGKASQTSVIISYVFAAIAVAVAVIALFV